MFHYIDKYAHDDSIVKIVFDHLRNFGLAALVLSAATWKQSHTGGGAWAIWDHSIALALALVGAGLIWLNHENLFNKIRNTPAARWIRLLFVLGYTIVSIELLKYLQMGRAGS